MRLEAGDALVVEDVQRDFCAGGALEVPGGDQVVEPLHRYVDLFVRRGLPVVYTRDWHPPDHVSFRERGGRWPVHCVAGSRGAEFHPGLPPAPPGLLVISKDARDHDAYSAFEGTSMGAELRRRGVRRIYVGGLATDYCVRATALDGVREGFEVFLLADAVRAVDVRPGDGQRALEEMARAGVREVRLPDLAGSGQAGEGGAGGQGGPLRDGNR